VEEVTWDNVNIYIYGLLTALFSGILLLIRKVLTNERQIELLKQHIQQQEAFSLERNREIKEQLSEIRGDVKQLMKDK
jgi:hypothetical protein